MILLDGKELAQLMIEHSVGVTVSREYKLKRLDLDYFVTEDEEGDGEHLTVAYSTVAASASSNP